MIIPLKIALWSLKSVKRLPGVQNDSPVMNTPGSLWLPGGEYTEESKLPGSEYTTESRLPCDEYTGESTSWCIWNKHRLPGVFTTGECIHYRGSLDSPVMNTQESRLRIKILLENLKNLKSFLGMSSGKRRSCLMKKTRVKKSRDTVPLTRNLTS
jgi:hypothetical protein